MSQGEAQGDHFRAEIAWDAARRRSVGRVTLRVRYAESDRMGVVFNAHYMTWFEIGRTELMRAAGTPYLAVEERGLNLPLVDASFRLRLPVRYDDVIAIETWVEQIRSRTISFSYSILRDGDVAAEGMTTHAFVRAADGRSVAVPDWLGGEIRKLLP
jgi:acyl-CoA thioester hydrolase